jgi:hypothetical protein
MEEELCLLMVKFEFFPGILAPIQVLFGRCAEPELPIVYYIFYLPEFAITERCSRALARPIRGDTKTVLLDLGNIESCR